MSEKPASTENNEKASVWSVPLILLTVFQAIAIPAIGGLYSVLLKHESTVSSLVTNIEKLEEKEGEHYDNLQTSLNGVDGDLDEVQSQISSFSIFEDKIEEEYKDLVATPFHGAIVYSNTKTSGGDCDYIYLLSFEINKMWRYPAEYENLPPNHLIGQVQNLITIRDNTSSSFNQINRAYRRVTGKAFSIEPLIEQSRSYTLPFNDIKSFKDLMDTLYLHKIPNHIAIESSYQFSSYGEMVWQDACFNINSAIINDYTNLKKLKKSRTTPTY